MRKRLAVLVAAAMSLVLVAFLVPLAILLKSVTADRAVTAATAKAQSLTSLVATASTAALRPAVDQLNTAAGHPVTVFLPDGTVLGAPGPRTPGVTLAAAQGSSLTVEGDDGREILVAVQGLPRGTAVVRAFVDRAELTRGLGAAWLVLAGLGVLLLALGVFVADRLARSIVRPVHELAAVSRRLADGDLDARARPGGPGEVRSVAAALNLLAARIRDLVRQEREAVADISHRLRTPLTVLRLDAETLRDPEEADRITGHAESLERQVTALIDQARARDAAPGACDAALVVRERADFWAVLAQDQERAVTVAVDPGPLPVAVGEPELAACLDALLGNVFAHTPEGTAYAIRLSATPAGARLEVSDEGPGFDEVPRGESGAGSTGLGLDIARQTARASGGTFSVTRARPHGARIALELGAALGMP
ncbi:signal transduction histidine kinase [Amycolatopsis lexingtonensis]|uniref:Signal transduction histidine-protein kinase/phosphatase MprB n=1 Tax=Amycolatopsis lexingtonensis TaxID=218822 RepID=A0ABR9HQ53_9PSEU|nr:HAMP domain-containing sensor histidine kinase [Amycolatopsis lexingtonensis]MBE1493050.1 signal transduction histidine kinase [Amycolatopsis lexingtonensis]